MHGQHHDENAAQGHKVANRPQHTARHQVLQIAHVVLDPRHETPNSIAVVECQVEPHEVRKQGLPQIEQAALRHTF